MAQSNVEVPVMLKTVVSSKKMATKSFPYGGSDLKVVFELFGNKWVAFNVPAGIAERFTMEWVDVHPSSDVAVIDNKVVVQKGIAGKVKMAAPEVPAITGAVPKLPSGPFLVITGKKPPKKVIDNLAKGSDVSEVGGKFVLQGVPADMLDDFKNATVIPERDGLLCMSIGMDLAKQGSGKPQKEAEQPQKGNPKASK